MTPPSATALRWLLGTAVAACALAAAGPVAAATITVTRTDDPPLGDASGCSLRQAVQAANTNLAAGACPPGEATLDTIQLPASVQLTAAGLDDANQTGDLDLLAGGPLRIVGTGATPSAIAQTAADRVMHLIGATLTLERVTVTGGTATGSTPAADGGGILVLSPSRLTLTRAAVSGNTAVQSGGIANGHRGGPGGTPGGEVLIVDSTVSGNTVSAASGGGMGAGGIGNINGALSVVNSTISGNATAGGRGGGVYSEALSGAAATVNIVNSTVTDNAGGGGGNLHNSGNGGIAAMRLRSTIVSAPRLTGNCGSSGNGDFTSVGYNLADDNGCRLNQATDQPGTDPLLAPLALGEGSTAVHVPAAGSPAIDRGTSDPALAGVAPLTADQRGLTRPVDVAGVTNAIAADGTDVGAVEVQPPPAAPAAPAAPSPGPVVVARDTSFALRLAVAARPRIDRRRVVLVRVTCPRAERSTPCRGTVTLRTRVRVRVGGARRIAVLATARFAIGAGRTATVRLRLAPARMRLVTTVGAARRAIVIVTARDGAGNRATLRRAVRLVPPRPTR